MKQPNDFIIQLHYCYRASPIYSWSFSGMSFKTLVALCFDYAVPFVFHCVVQWFSADPFAHLFAPFVLHASVLVPQTNNNLQWPAFGLLKFELLISNCYSWLSRFNFRYYFFVKDCSMGNWPFIVVQCIWYFVNYFVWLPVVSWVFMKANFG